MIFHRCMSLESIAYVSLDKKVDKVHYSHVGSRGDVFLVSTLKPVENPGENGLF